MVLSDHRSTLNKNKINEEASEISWTAVIDEDNPEVAYNRFCTTIIDMQDKYIIKKRVTHKEQLIQPWMTEGIRRAQKRRYKLYKNSKMNPNNAYLKSKYVIYKNKLCSIMRKAEQDHYHDLIKGAEGNQAKIWHVINDLIGKKKKSCAIPQTLISENGEILQNPKDICNEMNSFFSEVGPSLSSQIPQSKIDPLNYVAAPDTQNSFFLNPVSTNETLSKLQNIKPNKAHGPDRVHPRFVKDIAPYIAYPLTHIINQSIATGKIPIALKTARVVPSYKTGDKRKATNYRPISILPVFAKVYESLICDRLEKYLNSKQIIIQEQYGFQKKKNTTTALLSFIDQLQNSLDNDQHTLAVFIDLKKAFDTVNPTILLSKLEKYGIRGYPLEWFKDYFSERHQFIQTNEVQSSLRKMQCGVPQGSNLGPLLFLIYINDLPNCLKHSKAVLFADDTTIHLTGPKAKDISIEMNTDLQHLDGWLTANRLTLNVNRTHVCYFKPKNASPISKLEIRNIHIKTTSSIKYLGVHIDDKLAWKAHISYLTNKINNSIGVVCKIRRHLNRRSLLTIYYSLVHSNLVYCQEIWGTAFKTTLLPLIRAQKKILRVICRAPYQAHSEPLFQELGIRRLQAEIQARKAILAFKLVKNPTSYPIDINMEHSHEYPTRFKQENLPLQRYRTKKHGTKGIRNQLLQSYNSLHKEIKDLQPHQISTAQRLIKMLYH